MYYFTYDTNTPIGKITLFSEDDFLTGLYFGEKIKEDYTEKKSDVIEKAISQLQEYLKKERTDFDIKMKLYGTDFQKSVWEKLQTIPYGETRTYKQIAEEVESSKAYRAVGLANNKNPISIIIPCHRVISVSGNLTGYAGGLPVKRFLLDLESV